VNITSLRDGRDYLGVLDVDVDQDLQALAVSVANHPDFPSGWLFEPEADEWEGLANRWDAIEVK
jgi:hypothetical protein